MEPLIKSFDAQFKQAADGQPTDSDLALIQKYALVPLVAEQLYVRTMALCNDAYDRSHERFSKGYLNRFRDTLLGKSLLLNHDKRGALATGKLFRTNVVSLGAVNTLETSFYCVKTDGNADLRAQIDAGVVSHCSIGFRFDDLICDLCHVSYYGSTRNDATGERVWCPHCLGQQYDGKLCTATYGGDLTKVEGVEASLVYLGCQYGSEITKSALWDGEPAAIKERVRAQYFARNDQPQKGGEQGMTEEEKVAAAAALAAEEAEAACRAKAAESAAQAKAAEEAGARAKAEEQAQAQTSALALSKQLSQLQADLAEAEPLIADGRLYREDLKAEVKRLAGILEVSTEAELILKAAGQFDCTQLKALVAQYDARAEKLFPPQGVGQAQALADTKAPPKAQRPTSRGGIL